MSEPRTEAAVVDRPLFRDERTHDEQVSKGHRLWWRCIPLAEARLLEAEARTRVLTELRERVEGHQPIAFFDKGEVWGVICSCGDSSEWTDHFISELEATDDRE